MKAKHTPGPWLHSSTVLVCDSDARIIANCMPMVDVPELSIPLSQVDHNARLICAAPELLVALQVAYTILADIRHHWKGRDTAEGQGALCAMRDAIAKATGREDQDVQDEYTNASIAV